QNLHGYSVRLEHAHAGLAGLSITLNNLVVRQQANPEPPVALLPRLYLHLDWSALWRLHVAGEASFDSPRIHLDLPQLRRESADNLSPQQRGWQQALESIYPLKFNRFVIRDGAIVYVDQDPRYPLDLTHWNLTASNIRNIASPDRTYPSPIYTEAVVFGKGRLVVEGHANFLAVPFPGVHALYRLQDVPLDRLQPVGKRANLELRDGTLTTNGEIEYAPSVKRIEVADVVLDRVRLDYVHAKTAAAAEHGKAVASAARQAEKSSTTELRLDQLHLTRSTIGLVDRAQDPPYRIYVSGANLDVLNLANEVGNRQQQPASAHLTGKFMGNGNAKVDAVFRPKSAAADFGCEVAIENASLPALNDLLRAYQKIEVSAGTFSLYSQVTVKNGYLKGYVKPLLHDVEVADSGQNGKQPLGTRVKQKVVGVLAKVLKNQDTQKVATQTDISGPLGSTHPKVSEIIGGLLRNAFVKPLTEGLENAVHGKAGAK
ncbi:MAG: DUF748 domain-containing protein, partial [Acidobacteria bacterium]|nr:DUF748 domain-containing protein [Acidobacteriota bacterium]